MRLSTTISLALCATALALGLGLGGPVGVGLLAGTCLGASLSGFGVAVQSRLVAERPNMVLPAFTAAFGLKLLALFLLVGLVLLVPDLGRTLNPVALLLSFAAAATLVLLCGAYEISTALRTSPADPRPSSAHSRPEGSALSTPGTRS